MTSANAAASRLAPPTRRPSMSGSASQFGGVLGVTDPPYWMRTDAGRLGPGHLRHHGRADEGAGVLRRRPGWPRRRCRWPRWARRRRPGRPPARPRAPPGPPQLGRPAGVSVPPASRSSAVSPTHRSGSWRGAARPAGWRPPVSSVIAEQLPALGVADDDVADARAGPASAAPPRR